MANLVHDTQIDWPNGMGYTPCTSEFLATRDKRDAIHFPGDSGATMDSLSPEEYQEWNELDHLLMQMQLDGHLGKSVKY